MKATWRITAMLAALLMLLSMNAGAATPASLNQRMATRSGPGTQYTEELGTIPQGGQSYTEPAPQPSYSYSYGTPASLNQRMATRSGPGTQYTEELGTMPQETAITLIEYVTTGVPWGLVEFYRNGQKVRAYTGMKRINAYGPVAQGTQDYYELSLSQSTDVYYGPGYDYARRAESVGRGTLLRVYGYENGFAICDYKRGTSWVRAYFPVI